MFVLTLFHFFILKRNYNGLVKFLATFKDKNKRNKNPN